MSLLTKQKGHKYPPLVYPKEVHALRGSNRRAAKAAYFAAWKDVCISIGVENERA